MMEPERDDSGRAPHDDPLPGERGRILELPRARVEDDHATLEPADEAAGWGDLDGHFGWGPLDAA